MTDSPRLPEDELPQIAVPPDDELTAPEPPRPPSMLIAWLQLIRLPAVFTAIADIFLGYMLTHASLPQASQAAPLVLLLVTSIAAYWAGMILNDVFDLEQDLAERPERPIPSGRISRTVASRVGFVLLMISLTVAASLRWIAPESCGWNPLLITALLIACIVSYDGLLKATVLGPLLMGGCRFFNVLLGASAAGGDLWSPLDGPSPIVAAGLAVYVAGITWFARSEARESRRSALIGAMITVDAGLAILFAWLSQADIAADRTMAIVLLGVIALTLNKRMMVAISVPGPATVQAAVRTLLLSIITIDAAMIYAASGNLILATLLAFVLMIPAFATGRIMRMT